MIIAASLELPAELQYIPLVRHLALWLLNEMGVIERDAKDLEIVVGEVCNNVVVHASSLPDAKYIVKFEFFADRAVVTVADRGPGIVRGPVREPELAQVGGYGIWLVTNIADKVEFRCPEGSSGTEVQAEIALHYKTLEAREHAEQLEKGPPLEVTSGGGRQTQKAGAA